MVAPANFDPAFTDSDADDVADAVSVTVAEDADASTPVATVTATDPDDGDTLTYSLAGDAAELTAFGAAFDFATDTGAVTVKSVGSTLDFETKSTYTVTVQVSDSKDEFNDSDTAIDDTVELIITVTNVAEAPDAPTELVFSEPTYDSLTLSWTAPPNPYPAVTGYVLQWREAGGDDSDWTDVTHAGTATEFTIENLDDYDTAYEVRVAAVNGVLVNGANHGEWSAIATGATNRRKPGDDIVLDENNADPTGFYADDTTLWVADRRQTVLYRYSRSDRDAAATTFPISSDYQGSRGVWSDGATLWVAPLGAELTATLTAGTNCTDVDECLMAYDVDTEGRKPGSDIATSESRIRGLWSDGEIVWVVVAAAKAIAFDLATGTPRSDLDVTLLGRGPTEENVTAVTHEDVWSDGVSVWITTNLVSIPDNDSTNGSYVRAYPLDGSNSRTPDHEALDFLVTSAVQSAAGIWSDRDTLWVSGTSLSNEDRTRRALHAFVAHGTVANSPAFFGAARFADTLAVEVVENTTGYSLDLGPGDAEGDPLTLSDLGGDDEAKFTLSSDGVITQKPTTTFDFEDPDDAGADNVYELTVTVTDSKNEDGDAHTESNADPEDPFIDATVNITITITNADEAEGTITLNPAEPVLGQQITASLTDPDAVTAGNPTGALDPLAELFGSGGWLWQVADTANPATWDLATGAGGSTASYTPDKADLGRFLRVTAVYKDGTADDDVDSVLLVTAAVAPANFAPAFPDANTDDVADAVSVTVAEDADASTPVATVTATDPDDGDTLTYSLAGDAAELTAFGAAFDFDTDTGAVTVKSVGSTLDFETKSSYTVTVQVSDSKDAFDDPDTDVDDTVELTITVTNVAEAPGAPTDVEISDPTYDSLKVTWTVPTGTVTDYDVQWRQADQVPEAGWTDAGYDGTATEFTIEDGLDFDTSYDVQVRASDTGLPGNWSLIATGATNRRKPGDDIALHADNDDPTAIWADGNQLWVADADDAVLYRHSLDDFSAQATFALSAAPNGSWGVWSDGETVWVAPDSAGQALTLASGSRCDDPDTADATDASHCVQAYEIATGNRQGSKDVPLPVGTRYRELWSDGEIMWVASSDDKVLAFDLETGDRLSDLDIEYVDEGVDPNNSVLSYSGLWSDGVRIWVGTSVLASTHAPPRSESLARVYQLDRTDRDAALDLEVAADALGVRGVWSDRRTLWVSRREGLPDADPHYLRAFLAEGVAKNSPAFFGAARFADTLAVSVAENTTGYSLDLRPGDADDELSDLTLSALGGADEAKFTLSSDGVITQKATTTFDFEDPDDAGANNVYELTVTVTDSKDAADAAHTESTAIPEDPFIDATVNIIITVTDADEGTAGVITLDPAEPTALEAITASLTDSDGSITNLVWLWQVNSTATDMAAAAAAAESDWVAATGDGANTAEYTPAATDLGNFLRVTATYDDAAGTGNAARLVTAAVEPAQVLQNTNNAPMFANATEELTVAENAADGFELATVTATDPDDGDTLTYSLTGDAAELTAFDEAFDFAAGVFTVKAGSTLNFEAKASYSVTVEVTDGKDADGNDESPGLVDAMVAVTIKVNDVAEPANVALSYSDPWAGVTLIAGLADDDFSDGVPMPEVAWTWERSADGTSNWVPAPGTVTDGANFTSAYMPTAADIGWFLRATAAYTGPLVGAVPEDSFTATTTAAVIAAPECAAPANIVVTNTDTTAGELSGMQAEGLWSDGRILWVASDTRVSADASLSYPVTAFGLCDGTRDASEPQRYATVSGVNTLVTGMWAEGSRLWVGENGRPSSWLRAFTMTPQRGWVRDAQSDYSLSAASINDDLYHPQVGGMWSDGDTIWIGNPGARIEGTRVHTFAYDWADRPAPGDSDRSLDVRTDRDFDYSHVLPGATKTTGVASDGRFMWLDETFGGSDVEAVAFWVPDGSGDPVRVPAKNITLDSDDIDPAPATILVRGSWSDGRHLWRTISDDDNGPNTVFNGVFVQRIPNVAPTFPDADDDGADPVAVSVAEDAADGFELATLTATDLEEDTLTYSLDAATDAAERTAFEAAFSLDSATGEITVADTDELDFESRTSYTVTIAVSDSLDNVGDPETTSTADDRVVVTITVTDVAEGTASVTVSPSPPLVGWPVTAVLTDVGGDVATPTAWAWEVLAATDMAAAVAAADADWATAPGVGATTAAYTPDEADLNKFLRVTATHNGDPVRLVTEAVTDVLVSNLGRDRATDGVPPDEQVGRVPGNEARRMAGRFITGGAEHGYVITSVGAFTDADSDDVPEVSIFSDASGAAPGRRLFVLGNPTLPGTGNVNDVDSFEGGDEVRLAPNTAYHVVFADVKDTTQDHGYTVTWAEVVGQDGGAASGWSLQSGKHYNRPPTSGSRSPTSGLV